MKVLTVPGSPDLAFGLLPMSMLLTMATEVRMMMSLTSDAADGANDEHDEDDDDDDD